MWNNRLEVGEKKDFHFVRHNRVYSYLSFVEREAGVRNFANQRIIYMKFCGTAGWEMGQATQRIPPITETAKAQSQARGNSGGGQGTG